MNVRARGIIIAMPVVLTVLIAAVVGGLVLVQDRRESAQVARAEEIAQDYLGGLAVPHVGARADHP